AWLCGRSRHTPRFATCSGSEDRNGASRRGALVARGARDARAEGGGAPRKREGDAGLRQLGRCTAASGGQAHRAIAEERRRLARRAAQTARPGDEENRAAADAAAARTAQQSCGWREIDGRNSNTYAPVTLGADPGISGDAAGVRRRDWDRPLPER